MTARPFLLQAPGSSVAKAHDKRFKGGRGWFKFWSSPLIINPPCVYSMNINLPGNVYTTYPFPLKKENKTWENEHLLIENAHILKRFENNVFLVIVTHSHCKKDNFLQQKEKKNYKICTLCKVVSIWRERTLNIL